MSTAFTAALPLLEELKENLNRLKTATDEIEKAKQSAGEHQQAAKQLQKATDEAVRTATRVALSQEKLIDQLGLQHRTSLNEQDLLLREHTKDLSDQVGEQLTKGLVSVKKAAADTQEVLNELPLRLATLEQLHQQALDKQQDLLRQSTGEQELLLREHAENLTKQTTNQIDRQLVEVRQAAANVQVLIDKLIEEQPVLLATIGKQHQHGIDKQHELLRNGVQGWSDKLHEQMTSELKLLRQATEILQTNTRQQHDELSAVANQLQVVAGRVTAFAEVMNAAKFTTRLESIEQSNAANAAGLNKLAELCRQQGVDYTAELQKGHKQAAEAAEQHRNFASQELKRLQDAHEQQSADLRVSLEQVTTQLVQSGKQQRLWQVVTILLVVAVGAAISLLRG